MINDKGEEVGIIYCWYCISTDKYYVGQTIRPLERFKDHIDATINKKDNTKFHNALRKYKLENWIYCVLEENVLRANLNMMEMDWIEEFDSFHSGYNMTAGGGQTIFSEESRKKISESNKGKRRTKEAIKKISNARKGKHLSDETKEKLSKAHKGQIPWNTGKCLSDEHRKKISEKNKGKVAVNRRKVSKYDLNGNFVKEYDCILNAIKENPKASNISAVCKGERKQSGGFVWKYAS